MTALIRATLATLDPDVAFVVYAAVFALGLVLAWAFAKLSVVLKGY